MVKCISEGCQRNCEPRKDGYCGVCYRLVSRFQQNRFARGQAVDQRRNIGQNDGNMVPDINNQAEFPGAAAAQRPPLDMTKMEELYRKVEAGEAVENTEVIKSAFGMMIHVAASLNKVDEVKNLAQDNRNRIAALEAKVGGAEEVATTLGLAVQNLPLPIGGAGELENVREAFAEIRAQGVDVEVDIKKAVRKGHK